MNEARTVPQDGKTLLLSYYCQQASVRVQSRFRGETPGRQLFKGEWVRAGVTTDDQVTTGLGLDQTTLKVGSNTSPSNPGPTQEARKRACRCTCKPAACSRSSDGHFNVAACPTHHGRTAEWKADSWQHMHSLQAHRTYRHPRIRTRNDQDNVGKRPCVSQESQTVRQSEMLCLRPGMIPLPASSRP